MFSVYRQLKSCSYPRSTIPSCRRPRVYRFTHPEIVHAKRSFEFVEENLTLLKIIVQAEPEPAGRIFKWLIFVHPTPRCKLQANENTRPQLVTALPEPYLLTFPDRILLYPISQTGRYLIRRHCEKLRS